MSQSRAPAVSLVMCTYNPLRDLIAEALAHAGRQDIAEPWELVIVDNNSAPPLDEAALSQMAGRSIRMAREARQGLTFARCAGIAAARGDLICFADDDNMLAPDYLRMAARIAAEEPGLGAFGGRTPGRLGGAPGRLAQHYLPFMGVRDPGGEPLTGSGEAWSPAEPIGAGLVVRRPVAEAFRDFAEETGGAFGLGRSGGSLLSGEDSLFSRIAHRLGYRVGYRPALSLDHVIPADRLKNGYIHRLLEAQGRTFVILEALSGRRPGDQRWGPDWLMMAERFAHRVKDAGLTEARGHYWWDRGYFAQLDTALTQEAATQGAPRLDALGG